MTFYEVLVEADPDKTPLEKHYFLSATDEAGAKNRATENFVNELKSRLTVTAVERTFEEVD